MAECQISVHICIAGGEIIRKKVFDEIPLRVEYNMTEFGKELLSVLEEIYKWGKQTIKKIKM
ncbi:winged helix-turn-helix transcriptional regulator [Chryseobacterium sp. Mn2064]|uniref:winged helix-turn-helix transcriptional regulator n=1 Tax=Chryseobacterium sp. Mn2064 TaxID=3395263 RepID=UPI003BDEACE4